MTGCEATYEDDGPWDTVPWLVLVFPPLRRDHLTNGVSEQPHGVGGDLLSVA